MIVLDSSTLILVSKAELLDTFLGSVQHKVLITPVIEKECLAKPMAVDALMIQKAIREKRITVRPLKNRRLHKKLLADFPLGVGEAEVIALALSEKARLVGVDDKIGINACKLLKIPFATAVDILIRAQEKRLITRDEAEVKLSMLSYYGRYKPEIIADARLKLRLGGSKCKGR